MLKRRTALIAVALFLGTVGAEAQAPVAPATTAPASAAPAAPARKISAVLELFTSQGCSSCPAADALLAEYAARKDVAVLSLSVDYWDSLGWRDTLAHPRFTKRQKYYAKVRGDGQVYTPQLIVNGVGHANGARKDAIEQALTDATGKTRRWVPLAVTSSGTDITIEAGAAGDGWGGPVSDSTIWVVSITDKVDVMVRRGENAGRTLSYVNVVRDMAAVGTWTGKPTTIRLERQTFARDETDRLFVLLQTGNVGPIVGAAALALR